MTNSKGIKIGKRTRELYEQRDRSLDKDPDAPTLPLESWAKGSIGKYYRPIKSIKQPVAARIDVGELD